ncbi:hypothetical protein RV14_GL000273 [Enterococcus ratti]|uniref:Uncharacterized protein n=1 Tax=Enterococcus ratti TaxID=150033 RepID=A0A1L8WJA9_9ENTE|nr:hypothetical protein RV14_GL000273 [Enterococcus ratti]
MHKKIRQEFLLLRTAITPLVQTHVSSQLKNPDLFDGKI